jgi:DNA-binding IclR family transcriptional regulator
VLFFPDESWFHFHWYLTAGRATILSESIRAVERALDVLLCFSRQTPELSMTQIAERVEMHKSTVHRLLATLEKRRFVHRDPVSGLYRPGIRLLQMAYLTMENNDLRRLAAPYLRKLCDQFRETIDLCIMDDADVVFLDVIESPQRVKIAAATGQRLPAFCTASGKSILAYMPQETVLKSLEHGVSKYTDCTLVSPDEILENLRLSRLQGFATSVQEYEEGINAVAAPILDENNFPIAAIAIAGPTYRMTPERMLAIGPVVRATVDEIAQAIRMGMSPTMNNVDPPDSLELET